MKVSYDQILALRADSNVKLFAEETRAGYELSCSLNSGLAITAFLAKEIDNGNGDGGIIANPKLAGFIANVLPFCNIPVSISEVRFYTHDFANASTWSGKTCGDPSAFYVSGTTLHPLVGLWLDDTGAEMLAAYNNPEATGYYQNPAVLYGSLAHLISAQYDDINYRWVDNLENSWLNDPANHSFTNYCWLDLSPTIPTPEIAGSPPVWRDGTTNAIICQFDPTAGPDRFTNVQISGTYQIEKRGSWMGKDSNGNFTIDTTSSRWRIDPYNNYKIQLIKIGLAVELSGEIVQGHPIKWKPYGKPSNAQSAQLEAMGLPEQLATLPFEGPEWVYQSLPDLRFSCNQYEQTTSIEKNCKTPTVAMSYQYTESVMPILDYIKGHRLDIVIEGDIPISKTFMARGTFLARQYPSF